MPYGLFVKNDIEEKLINIGSGSEISIKDLSKNNSKNNWI